MSLVFTEQKIKKAEEIFEETQPTITYKPGFIVKKVFDINGCDIQHDFQTSDPVEEVYLCNNFGRIQYWFRSKASRHIFEYKYSVHDSKKLSSLQQAKSSKDFNKIIGEVPFEKQLRTWEPLIRPKAGESFAEPIKLKNAIATLMDEFFEIQLKNTEQDKTNKTELVTKLVFLKDFLTTNPDSNMIDWNEKNIVTNLAHFKNLLNEALEDLISYMKNFIGEQAKYDEIIQQYDLGLLYSWLIDADNEPRQVKSVAVLPKQNARKEITLVDTQEVQGEFETTSYLQKTSDQSVETRQEETRQEVHSTSPNKLLNTSLFKQLQELDSSLNDDRIQNLSDINLDKFLSPPTPSPVENVETKESHQSNAKANTELLYTAIESLVDLLYNKTRTHITGIASMQKKFLQAKEKKQLTEEIRLEIVEFCVNVATNRTGHLTGFTSFFTKNRLPEVTSLYSDLKNIVVAKNGNGSPPPAPILKMVQIFRSCLKNLLSMETYSLLHLLITKMQNYMR